MSTPLKSIGGITASFIFSAATASPLQGPTDNDFYSPPTVFDGGHGDLIWYRQADVNLGARTPPVNSWNVLYHSTDALGAPNKVTGTVIIPINTWKGDSERPVIIYTAGTHGAAQHCAPSMQMTNGTDYENANIVAALDKGYSVLITDYAGYTTGDTPTYMVGLSQAQAALDISDAAMQIPGANISTQAATAIWGYSQGGQTAAWASEIQHVYSPDMKLVAVAAGGTPANLLETSKTLDGGTGAAFMLGATIGLSEQYPTDWPLNDLLNETGKDAVEASKNECIFESLFNYMNNDIGMYTIGNKGLDQMLAEQPAAKQRLLEQNVGDNTVSVPLYQYHGQADEIIPVEQHYALKEQYCKKFDDVTFDLYPSEHMVTLFQATPYVLSWLGDRFDGKPTQATCDTQKPSPVSTALPGGSDFIVAMNNWLLNINMKLKTLGQEVALSKATVIADANLTQKTFNGSMSIPDIKTKLNIILPLDVKLSVTSASPISGYSSLDNEGILRISGTAYVNLKVISAGFGWFQIPFGCETETPAEFPLSFEGPISDLGAGNLSFTGITDFPNMRSCGWFNGLFTILISGPGQEYAISMSPPAPIAN